MPKIKRDQLTAESNHEGSSSIQDKQLEDDDDDYEQKQPKKKRFNFSIESIMQPTEPQLSPLSCQVFDSESPADAGSLRSGSPSETSNDCSRGSSPAPSSLPCKPSTSAGPANMNHAQDGSRLSQVTCQLDNKDMWDKFHSLNTEMIITKTGRRMFPVMKVQFQNLDPNARYSVAMDIVPVDNKRYRYAYHKSCWQVAGKADPSAETRLYMHPDSPFNGDLLARQVISFEKVKLTNNEMDKSGHIILNSMHKYQPRVYLIELKTPPPPPATHLSQHHHNNQHNHHNQHQHSKQASSKSTSTYYNQNQPVHNHQQKQLQSDIEGYRTFVFPETVFTAVTAYQNQLITKMKIDKNPFAKGFRDSSRLSDLDRNDPFEYMGSLGPSARFMGSGPMGAGSSLGDHSAANHMDHAYQLLASAANPWYSAAAVAAAAAASGGPPGASAAPPANPFNPMGACSTAQAAQLQATQMWLAAFSACLNGANGSASGALPPQPPLTLSDQQTLAAESSSSAGSSANTSS